MVRGGDSHALLGTGILARFVLLVLGIVFILLFQLWGLSGFLIAVVIYCRIASSRRGVNIHSYPMRWRSGNVGATYLFIITVLFMLISAMWFTAKNPEAVAEIFNFGQRFKLLSGSPNCVNPSYIKGNEFYTCQSLNSGVAMIAFLAPIGVAVFLKDFISFSQTRVVIGWRGGVKLLGFTLFVVLTPLLLPVGMLDTLTYFVFYFIYCLLYGQFFLAYFWLRISLS